LLLSEPLGQHLKVSFLPQAQRHVVLAVFLNFEADLTHLI
jgi:hypothetical protein